MTQNSLSPILLKNDRTTTGPSKSLNFMKLLCSPWCIVRSAVEFIDTI